MQIGLVATEPVTSHERTDAGPLNAQQANQEGRTLAPPQTPSGVFVSLLGDRQKQKEA